MSDLVESDHHWWPVLDGLLAGRFPRVCVRCLLREDHPAAESPCDALREAHMAPGFIVKRQAGHVAVETALLASAAGATIVGLAFTLGGQVAGVLSALTGAWLR